MRKLNKIVIYITALFIVFSSANVFALNNNEKRIKEIEAKQNSLHTVAEFFRKYGGAKQDLKEDIIKQLQNHWLALEEEKNRKEPSYIGSFKVYAYCPCNYCCGNTLGITATGTKATANHTVAVDPKVVPLGSKIIINGRTYVAEDTGGGIKGNKIDMFFNSHQEALQWGIKTLDVYLIN